jgi:hypothetical protein
LLNQTERVPENKGFHASADNYSAQKAQGSGLACTPPMLHITPASSSWHNAPSRILMHCRAAVEGFFAKLTRRRLKNGAFCRLVALQATADRFIKEHNAGDAKPFIWKTGTKTFAARNRGFQTLE